MKKSILLYSMTLFLSLILCSFSNFHDFFISITSIDYNSESRTLEITKQFTAHDLEAVIIEDYKIDLNIGEPNEYVKADSILFDYLKQTFQLATDKDIELKWVGKEFTLDETIWIYLESTPIEKPKEMKVTNSSLTEMFSSQSNITHLNFGSKQITYSFNSLNKTHNFLIP